MHTHDSPSLFSTLRKSIQIAIRSFSPRQFMLFGIFGAGIILSTILMLAKINSHFMATIPGYGGTLTEGIVGTPRFVNPLLAVSDADRDLSALIYSGLMKRNQSGEMVPDLAENYEVSPDGLTYTFHINPTATFHDGTPVTADDVLYTITAAKDPAIKSPKRVNWEGVTVTKIDNLTVTFEIKKPFAPFLENMSLGILPAHIWKNIAPDDISFSDFNINGTGSGPFRVDSIDRNSSGIPSIYHLAPFKTYVGGKPYLRHFVLYFYNNEKDLLNALASGEIDQVNAIAPEKALELQNSGYTVKTSTLPRIFGLFFNQNESKIFTDKKVIQAFNQAINKDAIVQKVLFGYGHTINSPVPLGMLGTMSAVNPISTVSTYTIDGAKDILAKDGWKPGADGILTKTDSKKQTIRLSFSIATGDTPELRQSAELIKEDLAAIGAEVEVKVFEIGTLNQNVIRPRKYDALFFGQVVNHESDLMAFWHSSQRNDPGLNIALYANSKTDKLLETALTTLDESGRNEKFVAFEKEIVDDLPAVFVYSPDFIYVTRPDIDGLELGKIAFPSDRLAGAEKWFIEHEHVWRFFLPNTTAQE